MYSQHNSESATRPVTPVPSLSQSNNTSPTTAGTRSPVTPTTTSYTVQYVTTPVTKKESVPLRGNRKARQKMSHQPISKFVVEKPLPSLPLHAVYDHDTSFMNWDSTDDEHGSKRVVQRVKQALKPRPRPAAQATNIRPRVAARNPDDVQNATPRSPPRPRVMRILTGESITASLKSTTHIVRAPSPLVPNPQPEFRHGQEMPPPICSRSAPVKISSDKTIPATMPPRIPDNIRASYRHSYDESSAIDSTFASLRELSERPRPSYDQRRAVPRPSAAARHLQPPTRTDLDLAAASVFLANEAREFAPPDTPTSASTTDSAKPKKFQKLFQSLKERTSFRDLRRGST